MQIRALTEADLPAFAEHFDEGNPAQLTRALRLRAEDTGLMLAAWLDDKPVGRVLVHWRPVPETPAEWHTGFAFLEELIVLEAHRSQGIGTAIIHEAAGQARERGFTTMAVGVGVDNDRARALYDRLGYMDAGLGLFEDRGTFLNSRGEQIDWHETWLFLTRAL